MIGHAVPDIPRIYTALAEWLSCGVFVFLIGPKRRMWRISLLGFAYLALLISFMELTATITIWLWVPCMLVAFSSMIGFIWFCNKTSFYESIFYGVMAFSFAECIASLEWQLVNTLFADVSQMPWYVEILILAAVYGAALFALWKLLSTRINRDLRLRIGYRDFLVSIIICVIVFVFSNLNFVTLSSSASGQYFKEIAYTRTMVDIAGVTMLYAHFLNCRNNMIKRELNAVQNALNNQYQHYKQSRESIELLNIKYHDMKHQINLLRGMTDSNERAAFLDSMEREIKMYELQNKTGNAVLDTLLTGKSLQCNKRGITMTVVADGKLLDFMDAMDICSIFGNALDNAIEAVVKIKEKEKRLIHVTVSEFKSFVVIHIENCYDGILEMDNGDLVTTKKNKEGHGYGIKSIAYTVENYGGIVDVKTNDNWFKLKILIPENKSQRIKLT